MKEGTKTRLLVTVLMLLVIICLVAILFWEWHGPEPEPTITPSMTSTATMTVTETPIFTETILPTATVIPTEVITPTVTISPTEVVVVVTPKPDQVQVNTGYVNGWLHFRECAGLHCRAQWWGEGAFPEGKMLDYLGCVLAPYPWAHVSFAGRDGYVYALYTLPNRCLTTP